MRILIVPKAVMLLVTIAHAADRKLPQKFVGNWCSSKSGPGYTRGSWCHDGDTGWMTVRVNGYESHEVSCKVLSAVPKSGNYLVKFKCGVAGVMFADHAEQVVDALGIAVTDEFLDQCIDGVQIGDAGGAA